MSGRLWTVTSAAVGARRTIRGVSLFREVLDRSESAVPTVGDLGQRPGCFGEALLADFVTDLAALSVSIDKSDALQDQEMFGDRLSTDGHLRGEGCRRGVTLGHEEILGVVEAHAAQGPEAIADALLVAVDAAGDLYQDNTTVVVVGVGKD